MREKILIMTVGCILLAPIFFALCSDSLECIFAAIIYGSILYVSTDFSPKVRKFWKKFEEINLEWMREK